MLKQVQHDIEKTIHIMEIRHIKMNKRWLSCMADSRITLNIDLIKAPSNCIDYFIIHELCHLKYANHNKDFFNLLFQIIPDWEVRKEKLEKIVFS